MLQFPNRIENYVNHNIYKLQKISSKLRGRQNVTLSTFSCFTERVDMGQLIQEEMKKYNIRSIHFWMITNNVSNIQSVSQKKILAEVAKYFAENKSVSFEVQYFVQKYISYYQNRFNKKQLENGNQFQEIKRHKTAMNLTSALFSKPFPIPEQLYRKSQQNQFQLSKSRLVQQLIRRQSLKQPTSTQFEDFMKKQAKIHTDPDAIKKYIFFTINQSIAISFIESHKKSLIKKIIEQDCDQFYDAKLVIKKSIFQSNHNYDDLFKKCNNTFSTTQTLYNKVILFLIRADKNQQQSLARRRTKTLQNRINPSIQALDQWKIKEENVDIISKLEKECDLIKQQIENQKVIFKNKIKVIENFIGESINIQKLIQEQDIQSNNHLMMLASQKKSTFHKIDLAPLQVQPQGTSTRCSVNNTYITSQFKRLKDISDAMRNIDNTLLEQNKKIQSAQKQIKELIKKKQSIIYSNAVELNRLRQAIQQAKSEMVRKEIQIAEIQKNGTLSQLQNYKSREPSYKARITLQKYQQFCNNIKIVNNQDPTQEFVSTKYTNKRKLKMDVVKVITHKSLHCGSFKKPNLSQVPINTKLKDKRMEEAEECLSRFTRQNQQDFLKINKKIKKELMFGQSLNESIEYTQHQNQNILKVNNLIKIQKLYEQLVTLFQYYNKNNQIQKQMKTQMQNYKIVKQQALNTFVKQTTNQVENIHQLKKKDIKFDWNSFYTSENQLQLEDFPILKQYILQEIDKKKANIRQNDSLNRHKSGKIFKQQLKYPRDCFQIMLYGDKKQKNTEILTKTVTSIKSQLYDKMLEEQSQKVAIDRNLPLKQAGKQKRITIQQAIKLSNYFNPHRNK